MLDDMLKYVEANLEQKDDSFDLPIRLLLAKQLDSH